MKLHSDIIRTQADKLGYKVIDIAGVAIGPSDINSFPKPSSWAAAGRVMVEAAARMKRIDVSLTPEEKSLYERFSVAQAQAMAQGRRGDSSKK